MLALVREVRRRHPGLWLVGGLNLALVAVFLLLMPFDHRTVTGIDDWIKPLKFAASVGIYLWTIAWLLPHLRLPRWLAGGLGWAVALTMLGENFLLMSQAVAAPPPTSTGRLPTTRRSSPAWGSSSLSTRSWR